MRRIYYLSTCNTNKKILSLLNTENVELVNIKTQHISQEDLAFLHKQTGSYEALFNKNAQKYKVMSPEEKPTNEAAFKNLILSHYTFLKRPAAIIGDEVIVGSSAESVTKLVEILGPKK